MGSFFDRTPTIEFGAPSYAWLYLAIINEKLRLQVTWEVVRVAGEARNTPTFLATPIWCETERLVEYSRSGGSKKLAMRAAAEAMAQSGHC